MPPSRKEGERAARRRGVERLRQDAPAAGDDGVGAEHKGVGVTARDAPRLLLGEPEGMPRRQLVRQRRLVDGGGIDQVRRERDLGQKVETARRGRGENEALVEVIGCQLSVLG
jgi:hypothetical protein